MFNIIKADFYKLWKSKILLWITLGFLGILLLGNGLAQGGDGVMTVEEIHQKLLQNFAGGMEKINVKGGRRCRLSSRYQKKYCMIQSKR